MSLVKEYDDYYTADPDKWTNDDRNQFAYSAVRPYAKQIKTVLDIGCGNGHTIAYFQKHMPQRRFYGIDLSPVAVEIATKKTGAIVTASSVEDYDAPVMFDLVLCMGTVEHFIDPFIDLRTIRKITGGKLYLEIPDNLSYSKAGQGYHRLTGGSRQWEWHKTRAQWEEIIQLAGWRIARSVEGLKKSWRFVWILE